MFHRAQKCEWGKHLYGNVTNSTTGTCEESVCMRLGPFVLWGNFGGRRTGHGGRPVVSLSDQEDQSNKSSTQSDGNCHMTTSKLRSEATFSKYTATGITINSTLRNCVCSANVFLLLASHFPSSSFSRRREKFVMFGLWRRSILSKI